MNEIAGARGAATRLLVAASLLVIIATRAQAVLGYDESICGSLTNAYGPFDYRSTGKELAMVEAYHFTRDVEMLKAGTTGPLGGDIDYTLRAFPNHHRALVSMMNLQFKTKSERPRGTHWTVGCYFDRAMEFKPDDGRVRTVYGVYLMRLGRTKDAIEQFGLARELGDDSGNLHYNLGLAYFETNDFDKSVAEAKRAAELGFNLPGLRDKLTKAGKWQ